MFLKNLNFAYKKLGYGEIGTEGFMGYENLCVSVNGKYHENSISAHPPSKIVYNLNGDYNWLNCELALNDTSDYLASANFLIYADDILVYAAYNVRVNEKNRIVSVNINYCKKLTLEIQTNCGMLCHALWIDPIVSINKENYLLGCMGGLKIENKKIEGYYDLCIATIVTSNYIEFAYRFFESLVNNSKLKNYKIIIFTDDTTEIIQDLADKYSCSIILINITDKIGFNLKTCVYSSARFIDADKFLLIDIDTIIQFSVSDLIESLNHNYSKSLLIAKEYNVHDNFDIVDLINIPYWPYFGDGNDAEFLGLKNLNQKFISNGGVILGKKEPILALDDMIRSLMPQSFSWIKKKPEVQWREQGILNIALSKLNNIVELDPTYNYQLLFNNLETAYNHKIIHFNGEPGKDKFEKYDFIFKNHIINNSTLSELLDNFNLNSSNDLPLYESYDINFINFTDYNQRTDNILIFNDTYGIYATKFALETNANICTFESSRSFSNKKIFSKTTCKNRILTFLENENINQQATNYDLLIINHYDAEIKTFNIVMMYSKILNSHGQIFITNIPSSSEIKERLIDAHFEIEDYETFIKVKMSGD